MTTLLLAEHDNKTLKDATQKALTAAKALGQDVHVLVAGKDCRAVAEAAAKLDGVNKVLLAEAASYEHMLAEPMAALIQSLAGDYDAIVAAATTMGKNIMPRVAALLDVMQISDIVKVIAPDTFERLIYAGNAVQTVRSKDKIKVITVRTSTFQATGPGGSAPVLTAADLAPIVEPIADRMVVEITEHEAVDDYDELARWLAPLRALGVRIAIDDAGAGYASLRHTLQIAPDIVKVDISLTRSIDGDRGKRALARALISFAQEMDMTIVAEGIETDAELQTLLELGVRYGQGYFLAQPGTLPGT